MATRANRGSHAIHVTDGFDEAEPISPEPAMAAAAVKVAISQKKSGAIRAGAQVLISAGRVEGGTTTAVTSVPGDRASPGRGQQARAEAGPTRQPAP